MSPKLHYILHAAVDHTYPNHPECPARIKAIEEALKNLDLTAAAQIHNFDHSKSTNELLQTVHKPEYIESIIVASESATKPTAIKDIDDPDGPTYATSSTWRDIAIAVAAVVSLVDAIVQSPEPTAGFSLCRPPGHHATPNEYMGFCFLNNVAIAARYAQLQKKYNLERIAILDFDVHHGNGTQDIFYDDDSVLFIDMHQHEVWPGTGAFNEIGTDAGTGYTVNIGLPRGAGHTAAIQTFEQLIKPLIRRFNPDLLLISVGFDAHEEDPLEQLHFQSRTFYELALKCKQLADELCGGKCLFVLEGGYCTSSLAESVCEVFRALLGQPSLCLLKDNKSGEPCIDDMIRQVKELHSLS